jgi:hypothetical protein
MMALGFSFNPNRMTLEVAQWERRATETLKSLAKSGFGRRYTRHPGGRRKDRPENHTASVKDHK